MKSKKLTIAGIQIYFDDDGVAQCAGSGDKPRSTVEQELTQYRDFIDQWLGHFRRAPAPKNHPAETGTQNETKGRFEVLNETR
ncbi:MAG: hypothetical protein ABI806_26310 [Candidatus Solibacter sp.]